MQPLSLGSVSASASSSAAKPASASSAAASASASSGSSSAAQVQAQFRAAVKHGASSPAQKYATLGAHVTEFGDCMPFCDRVRLKSLIKDWIVAYNNSKPLFGKNICGCMAPHCFAEYAVARLAEVDTIIENGVNMGMSGYLFRSAKPHAHVYHVDPRARPICNQGLDRWNDTGAAGLVHYYTGPSKSLHYQAMMNIPGVIPETEANKKYAESFNSKGFEDFFAIDWSGVDRDRTLVFFDTHQRDFENLVKGIGMGFKLFLFDDNYNGLEDGDMGGWSIKQTFSRGGGQAKNLADALDFYYEMPPLINPFTVPEDMLDKYHIRPLTQMPPGSNTVDKHDYMKSQRSLLDLADAGDRQLFEAVIAVTPVAEFRWYTHMAVAGKYA